VNPKGMFWIVTNGKYRIIDKKMFNNSQDTIVTPGTVALVTNIAAKGILMKEKPIAIFHDLKFFVSIVKSLFINLCDSFDKNGPSPPNVLILVSMNS
jgi:hypothetical protein